MMSHRFDLPDFLADEPSHRFIFSPAKKTRRPSLKFVENNSFESLHDLLLSHRIPSQLMKICPKYTFGVGDRFTNGVHAQLARIDRS
jgi:hypothetical protein